MRVLKTFFGYDPIIFMWNFKDITFNDILTETLIIGFHMYETRMNENQVQKSTETRMR
jgi:hypothetical protein